jgi:hypothetical protein
MLPKKVFFSIAILMLTGLASAELLVYYDFQGVGEQILANKGSGVEALEIRDGASLGICLGYSGVPTLVLDADGVDDYAYLNRSGFSDAIANSGKITVAFWFKSTGENHQGDYLFGGKYSPRVVLNDGQVVRLDFNPSTSVYQLYGTTDVNDRQWHHIAYTADKTTEVVRLYIDGVIEDEMNYEVGNIYFDEHQSIGARYYIDGGTEVIKSETSGLFDEFRMYDECLYEADIEMLADPRWVADNNLTDVVYASPLSSMVSEANGLEEIDFDYWSNNSLRPAWNIGGSDYNSCSLVLVFELPDVPDGNVLASADLQVLQAGNFGSFDGSSSGDVDLYGLRTVPAGTDPNYVVLPSDWYVGAYGFDTDGYPLMKSFLYSELSQLWCGLEQNDDEFAAGRLRCWLQKQYDNGAVGGDYVLLRLNFNELSSIERYYNISSIWFDNGEEIVEDITYAPRIVYSFADPSMVQQCPQPDAVCVDGQLDGDINFDCSVNIKDFAIMAQNWTECYLYPDTNCD